MKIFRLFAATLFIATIAVVSAFAQGTGPARTTPPAAAAPTGPVPASKIAVVNTQAFDDEKTGITKFVNVLKNLQREFQPTLTELQGLDTRIRAIADEIAKTRAVADPNALRLKQEEGEKLQRDLEYKKKDYDARAAKRYEEVVGPISKDIGLALDAFAKQRGITMIIDLSKQAILESVITLDPAMDVTAAFIAEYNSKNPATASTAAPGR
jgi:Skp family chaperone for outer membrane proteins